MKRSQNNEDRVYSKEIVCVCVCVCVRARVRVRVCVCVCVRVRVRVPVVLVLFCTEKALQRIPGALVLAAALLALVLALLQALLLALALASVLTAVPGPGGLAGLWLPTGGAPRPGFSSAGLPAGAGGDGTDGRHSDTEEGVASGQQPIPQRRVHCWERAEHHGGVFWVSGWALTLTFEPGGELLAAAPSHQFTVS